MKLIFYLKDRVLLLIVHQMIMMTLIVDEAHHLNTKSGIFANKGENQIKEIITHLNLVFSF